MPLEISGLIYEFKIMFGRVWSGVGAVQIRAYALICSIFDMCLADGGLIGYLVNNLGMIQGIAGVFKYRHCLAAVLVFYN